jgi:hypothetical protein
LFIFQLGVTYATLRGKGCAQGCIRTTFITIPNLKADKVLSGDRMSAHPLSSSHDGQINLAQQRKRAKELLRRLKTGASPDKLSLLANRHPSSPVTLAQAQWLIAKELGFASWPKLKAHIDAIDFAARHPSFAADDEINTLHWRCGNDIEHNLRLAGFKGTFQTLTDPLCMGPVQALPAEEYQAIRSRYISQAFGMKTLDVAHRLADEYHNLKQLSQATHCVLWCEADAYDQLFLIRVLAELEPAPIRLELIEINQIPGIERFIGMGQLSPDLLAWLWPQRRLIEQEARQLARQIWLAYCDASPVKLATFAHEMHRSLPLLAPALLRQLQELPGIQDGLSLTERLSLQIVQASGPVTYGKVFAELMAGNEPLPYLGDLMFYAALQPLIATAKPLLTESDAHLDWPRRVLALTELGHLTLNGKSYWPDHATHERWVGGVCIHPGQPHWAIDENINPLWRV